MSPTDSVIPPNEAERLAAVRRYAVLDTPPDGAFDRITRMASQLIGTPIAIVSIVDEDRIWFKSRHGLDVDEIGRDPGLCASAILQRTPWVVENAAVDPRTLTNPLVAGDLGLRFYAGVPLVTPDGYGLGTLCVIDQQPRELTDQDRGLLEDLAAMVMDELELRRAIRETKAALDERARHAAEMNDDVVQALAVAKLSLEVGDSQAALASVAHALTTSRRILDELAGEERVLRRSVEARTQ